jgi:hypothetical protein
MAADSMKKVSENWGEGQRYGGDGDGGEDGPEQEGVPLP